jgi:hypothetical protein
MCKKAPPGGAFKSFGRIVFNNDLVDFDGLQLTMSPEPFFLISLRVTFVSLLIGTDPDI